MRLRLSGVDVPNFCAGFVDPFAHGEINLIGFIVVRSEILEFRRLTRHVSDARSCPGTKSAIAVVDITRCLQAVERKSRALYWDTYPGS